MLAKRSRGAANFLFKRVRVLIRFAIATVTRDDDPTDGLECKPIGREHHTWTDEEISNTGSIGGSARGSVLPLS